MTDDPKSTITNFDIEVVNQNSRESCCDVFRKEFTQECLGFNFGRADVFTTSQWHIPRLVFLVYRLVVAAYAVSVVFYSVVQFNRGEWYRLWPLRLTCCSYFMLTSYLLCSAIIAMMSFFDQPSVLSSKPLPFYLKLNWFFFVIGSSAAFLVTILFYLVLLPVYRVNSIVIEQIHMHVINSLLVIFELAVSAIPVRILHFVYVLAYCAVYVAISAIFWAYDHSYVFYRGILDWNFPITTFALVLGVAFVVLPILQFILFAAYRLRLYVYSRIYHSSLHEGN